MCGILGIIQTVPDNTISVKIASMLQIQKNRGHDAAGFLTTNFSTYETNNSPQIQYTKNVEKLIPILPSSANIIIAHTLHAVVSNIPQPISSFDKKCSLVANCEIYNWQEIADMLKLNVKNDAELLLKLLESTCKSNISLSNIRKALKPINGVYAFAFLKDNKLILGRDIIGEKPLHYAKDNDTFYFASESKTLREVLKDKSHLINELNPRHLLCFDSKSKKVTTILRPFYKKVKEVHNEETKIIPKLNDLLIKTVRSRLPDPSVKIGVLFSGGVDSTLIAQILKKLNRPFTCYTAALIQEGLGESTDLLASRDAANKLGFDLKEITINLEQTQEIIKELVPLIESSNVVKVGVALPFHLCCKKAAEDGVKVIFSGLGSEELFAGYERHTNAADVNQECISGLRKMYERDLYRDDVVTMNNTVELRLPFLDDELIRYALQIPSSLKIVGEHKKYILRKCAQSLGLPQEFAWRPKQAAQYGSKFDRAISKLATKNGYVLKSAYLHTFFPAKNQRLGVLFSSGKDSMYALYTMHRQSYPISCLITLESKNLDSYMFHTPAINLAKLQAKSLNIPLITKQTAGEKETELIDLKKAIILAKNKYHIDGIVTGALYSVYQRERIEKIAEELGIKVFSPLWHIDQEKELRQIIDSKFNIILTQVAAEGLDKSWLGKELTNADVDNLVKLNKKLGINIAGEGGEFESLVVDCPLFTKKLVFEQSETISDGGKHTLKITNATLKNK